MIPVNTRIKLFLYFLLIGIVSSIKLEAQNIGNYVTAASCTISLELTDANNDGWGSSYVLIRVNNGSPQLFTYPSTHTGSYFAEIPISNEANVQISYNSGVNDTQNSFKILNASGDQIFADGPNFTSNAVPSSTTSNLAVGCPMTCSGSENYFLVIKTGQNPEKMAWELTSADGTRVAFALEDAYIGFTPGMTVQIPLLLNNCTGYDFKAFNHATDAWTDGAWEIVSSNTNRGELITENGPSLGFYGITEGPSSFVENIASTKFTLPCMDCPIDVVSSMNVTTSSCSAAGFVYPSSSIPEIVVCYPDPFGHGTTAPVMTVSYPTAINPLENVEPETAVDLPVGDNLAIFKIVYADGQIVRCTSSVKVVTELSPNLNCGNLLNLSIDGLSNNCSHKITPNFLLQQNQLCEDEFVVEIRDANNNIIGDVIDGSYVGQTLNYSVFAISNSNFCSGQIRVEDKKAPVIECRDYTVNCNHPELINENYELTDTITLFQTTPYALAGYGNTSISFIADCYPLGEVIKSIEIDLDIEHSHFEELGEFTLVSPTGLNFPLEKSVNSNFIQLNLEEDLTTNPTILANILGQEAHLFEGEWFLSIRDTLNLLNVGSLKTATLNIKTGFKNLNALEDCGTVTATVVSERLDIGSCSNNSGGTLIRVWQATDDSGNNTTCTQTIIVKKPQYSDLVLPESVTVKCGDPFDVATLGGPIYGCNSVKEENLSGCRLSFTYTDVEYPSCGESKIIHRNWNILNWCTSVRYNHTQIITILDDVGPAINLDDLSISANFYTCDGTIALGAAVSDDCSGVQSITATYYLKTGPGEGYYRTLDITNNEPLNSLQIGLNTVIINAFDNCGNISKDTITVNVMDDIEPSAVCNNELSLNLSSSGSARVFASDVNEGSYDNCGIQEIKIRRTNNSGCIAQVDYANYIDLDCCDVNTNVSVDLQVKDIYGNVNSCIVNIIVKDKYLPNINCVADTTINCNQIINLDDLSSFGTPSTLDNCTAMLTETVTDNRNDCGQGTVVRNFSATDDYGNSKSCEQIITIIGTETMVVQFPRDTIVLACSSNADILFGEPIITNVGCSNIAISHTDAEFETNDSRSCSTIRRKWKVINWCTANPNEIENPTGIQIGENTFEDDGDGYFEFYQIISFRDQEAPVYAASLKDTVYSIVNGCQLEVNMPQVVLSDNCSNNVVGNPSPSRVVGQIGDTTIVRYSAEDDCGNLAFKDVIISFVDKGLPSPVCYSGLNVNIPDINGLTVKPTLFVNEASITDNCINTDYIQYSFSEDIADTLRQFDCDELGAQQLRIWATDQAGNQQFCSAQFFISDSLNLCTAYSISGVINTINGVPIEDAAVILESSNDSLTATTNTIGKFEFDGIEQNEAYRVTSNFNSDVYNGVSTIDLILIQRHILGLNTFDSFEKYIAADVNNSKTITAADLIQIRRIILKLNDQFSGTDSWRMLDANYAPNNLLDILNEDLPFHIDIKNLNTNKNNVDFIGIKMGDINTSASVNNLITTEQRNTEVFNIESIENSDGTYSHVFKSNKDLNLAGFQFALENLENIEVGQFESTKLKINENNLSVFRDDLLVSWNAPLDFEKVRAGEEIFRVNTEERLSFHLKEEASFKSEVYLLDEQDIQINKLSLEQKNIDLEDFKEMEATIFPNPFDNQLKINFNTIVEVKSITIFNSLGQGLKALKKADFHNTKQLFLNDLNILKAGIYIVKIETNEETIIKKVIKK